MTDLTKQKIISLKRESLEIEWDLGEGEVPEALRHAADTKAVKRLIRNAGSVFVPFSHDDFCKAQKTSLLEAVDARAEDVEGVSLYICIFNGVDLFILGEALDPAYDPYSDGAEDE